MNLYKKISNILLSVLVLHTSIFANAGNVRVLQIDSINKQAKIEYSRNGITIEPVIGRIKDNVGLRVGFLFWSTEIFTGDETRLDKDIYFIITGTPDNFYFNLVNLQCDNGYLMGAQVVARLFSTGQVRYSTKDGMYSSRQIASRFLVNESAWLFHKIGGSSYEKVAENMRLRLQADGRSYARNQSANKEMLKGLNIEEGNFSAMTNKEDSFNYLCSSEFKSLMAEYHTSNVQLQHTDPFQVRFESKNKPKLTISWTGSWVDPNTVITKNLLLKSQELLQANIVEPAANFSANLQVLYQSIIGMRKDLLQSISNTEYGLREKVSLSQKLYNHNSGPMINLANSIEDFIGSMSFIRMMASPLSGSYAAELMEKSAEIMSNLGDIAIQPEEEKVRGMQLEDLKQDLTEKVQRFEKYLEMYLNFASSR